MPTREKKVAKERSRRRGTAVCVAPLSSDRHREQVLARSARIGRSGGKTAELTRRDTPCHARPVHGRAHKLVCATVGGRIR